MNFVISLQVVVIVWLLSSIYRTLNTIDKRLSGLEIQGSLDNKESK
jgi:hypothetical protein